MHRALTGQVGALAYTGVAAGLNSGEWRPLTEGSTHTGSGAALFRAGGFHTQLHR